MKISSRLLLVALTIAAAHPAAAESPSSPEPGAASRPYRITVGAGFVDSSSSESSMPNGGGTSGPGNNIHGTFSDPLLLGSLGVTILPDTLNLSISVGGAITSNALMKSSAEPVNRGSYESDVDFVRVALHPSFAETSIGSFGLGYEKFTDNRELKGSNSGAPSHPVNVLDRPNDGKNPGAFTGQGNMVLDRTDSFGFQRDYTRLSLFYNLPVWDNGLGVELARESGHRQFYLYNVDPTFLTSSTAFVSRAEYTGNRIAAGIMRDRGKLANGFALSKLYLFRTSVSASWYDYLNARQTEVDGAHFDGFGLELNYRTKVAGYDVDTSLFGEMTRETFPDRAPVAGCISCGSGDIQRTQGYGALMVSVSF